MEEFSAVVGEINYRYGNFKWQKLNFCASYFGFEWGKMTYHDSLADCKATLFCYKKMQLPEVQAQIEKTLNFCKRK